MKADNELLRTITSGYTDIIEEGGAFRFLRFTDRQYSYYRQVSPKNFYRLAYACTGIRFDFITDAAFFAFDFEITELDYRFYYFDVFIDGILTRHDGEETMWLKKGRLTVPLPGDGGEHRITVWFPVNAAVSVRDAELSDGASVRGIGYRRKMLCLGDSITQGYTARYPSLCYTNRLAAHFDAYMINQGIGGERFPPDLIDPEFAASFVPDIVTAAYGTNDWSGSEGGDFRRRCDGFMARLAEFCPSSAVFVITPLWRADKDRVTRAGTFEEAVGYIRERALFYGHRVIDGGTLLPRFTGFYNDLRLHPNDLGFEEYARRLIPEIEKQL